MLSDLSAHPRIYRLYCSLNTKKIWKSIYRIPIIRNTYVIHIVPFNLLNTLDFFLNRKQTCFANEFCIQISTILLYRNRGITYSRTKTGKNTNQSNNRWSVFPSMRRKFADMISIWRYDGGSNYDEGKLFNPFCHLEFLGGCFQADRERDRKQPSLLLF